MVHFDGFVLEKDHGKDHEYHQGDDFLKDFEFDKGEWPAVFFEANSIGRYLKEVLKEGNAPTDHHNADQTEIFKPFKVFELQVPVPGEGHKGVGQHQ